jgi:hypothetical protein
VLRYTAIWFHGSQNMEDGNCDLFVWRGALFPCCHGHYCCVICPFSPVLFNFRLYLVCSDNFCSPERREWHCTRRSKVQPTQPKGRYWFHDLFLFTSLALSCQVCYNCSDFNNVFLKDKSFIFCPARYFYLWQHVEQIIITNMSSSGDNKK